MRRLSVTIVVVEMLISIAHSVCVCVCVFIALVIQHAMRMLHIVICGPPGICSIFPHYLINGTIFFFKVNEHKICVYIVHSPTNALFIKLWKV